MFTKLFYYGEGTDHKVRLTQAEADAANKIRIKIVDEAAGLFQTNLTDKEMRAYNSAAAKLNKYIAKTAPNGPGASDEYLENNDILRPVR